MQVVLNKWGNSVGLRMPNSILQELGIKPGHQVSIKVESGKAIIEPVRTKEQNLMALLDLITKENLHGEISTGVAVGKENI